MSSKTCRICGETLPITLFYKHTQTKDKLRHECKNCTNAKNRLWAKNNPDKLKVIYDRQNKHPRRKENYQRDKEQNKIDILIGGAKQRAKKFNLPFNLEKPDVARCDYCPVLNMELDWNASRLQDNSPSIDRIIPELGYVKGNVRIMSNLANRMKSNATESQLKEFAVWIRENV